MGESIGLKQQNSSDLIRFWGLRQDGSTEEVRVIWKDLINLSGPGMFHGCLPCRLRCSLLRSLTDLFPKTVEETTTHVYRQTERLTDWWWSMNINMIYGNHDNRDCHQGIFTVWPQDSNIMSINAAPIPARLLIIPQNASGQVPASSFSQRFVALLSLISDSSPSSYALLSLVTTPSHSPQTVMNN